MAGHDAAAQIASQGSLVLREGLAHDVPARALPADYSISCLFECGQITAEAVAGRIRIDGIPFKHGRSVSCRMFFGGGDHFLKHPLPTERPQHEEAHDRPDFLLLVTRHHIAHRCAIGVSRRDRAPCDRLCVKIAEQSNRFGRRYASLHLKLFGGGRPLHLRERLHCSPYRAPARFGTASALKELFKIVPTLRGHRPKGYAVSHQSSPGQSGSDPLRPRLATSMSATRPLRKRMRRSKRARVKRSAPPSPGRWLCRNPSGRHICL
jgi:hypothetical protein